MRRPAVAAGWNQTERCADRRPTERSLYRLSLKTCRMTGSAAASPLAKSRPQVKRESEPDATADKD